MQHLDIREINWLAMIRLAVVRLEQHAIQEQSYGGSCGQDHAGVTERVLEHHVGVSVVTDDVHERAYHFSYLQ
jgi:hypothetical protein